MCEIKWDYIYLTAQLILSLLDNFESVVVVLSQPTNQYHAATTAKLRMTGTGNLISFSGFLLTFADCPRAKKENKLATYQLLSS